VAYKPQGDEALQQQCRTFFRQDTMLNRLFLRGDPAPSRLKGAATALWRTIGGITGRLQLEWVAGMDRNQRPSSLECAVTQ
jgi:hypothetical protein